jgi:hypothetical protein
MEKVDHSIQPLASKEQQQYYSDRLLRVKVFNDAFKLVKIAAMKNSKSIELY